MLNFTHFPTRWMMSCLAGILAMTLATGCTEPPEACFSPSITLTDANAEVTFDNCSERATGYVWNFGDGATSTEANPTHIFTTEGQYIVSLTAEAKASLNDDLFKTLVVVGQRVYASASITALPATNPSGGAWDVGDNPDIAVRFAQGSNVAYQSTALTNAPASYPITVPPPGSPVTFSPATWTITVVDIDGLSEEVMATFSVNFASYVPGATKTISLTATNASMSLTYALR